MKNAATFSARTHGVMALLISASLSHAAYESSIFVVDCLLFKGNAWKKFAI